MTKHAASDRERLSADDAVRRRRGALVVVVIFGFLGIAAIGRVAASLYAHSEFVSPWAVVAGIGVGAATAAGYVAANTREGAPRVGSGQTALIAAAGVSMAVVVFIGCWAWSRAVLG